MCPGSILRVVYHSDRCMSRKIICNKRGGSRKLFICSTHSTTGSFLKVFRFPILLRLSGKAMAPLYGTPGLRCGIYMNSIYPLTPPKYPSNNSHPLNILTNVVRHVFLKSFATVRFYSPYSLMQSGLFTGLRLSQWSINVSAIS